MQAENEKTTDRMACKIQDENKMLVDKLKQHVAQETNKLENDVS